MQLARITLIVILEDALLALLVVLDLAVQQIVIKQLGKAGYLINMVCGLAGEYPT